MSEVILADESYAIMGAAFEVYNVKGSGFLEPVYHECLEIEFQLRRIPYAHEPRLPLSYKGQALKHTYSPDFVCWDKIILELKACDKIADEHLAQALNYLNATGLELALLLNFGHHAGLEYKRIVRSGIRVDSRHSREVLR